MTDVKGHPLDGPEDLAAYASWLATTIKDDGFYGTTAAILKLTAMSEALSRDRDRAGEQKDCRARIIKLIRDDFDPTPSNWDGPEWHDNAEDVADAIIALFARLAAQPVAEQEEQPVAYAFVVDGECEEIGWGAPPLEDPSLVLLYPSPAPDDVRRMALEEVQAMLLELRRKAGLLNQSDASRTHYVMALTNAIDAIRSLANTPPRSASASDAADTKDAEEKKASEAPGTFSAEASALAWGYNALLRTSSEKEPKA